MHHPSVRITLTPRSIMHIFDTLKKWILTFGNWGVSTLLSLVVSFNFYKVSMRTYVGGEKLTLFLNVDITLNHWNILFKGMLMQAIISHKKKKYIFNISLKFPLHRIVCITQFFWDIYHLGYLCVYSPASWNISIYI